MMEFMRNISFDLVNEFITLFLFFKDLILYSARFNDIKGQEKLRKARLPIHALSLRLNKQAKHDET